MAWVGPGTSPEDRSRIIGDGSGTRVHAVEYGWLEAIRTAEPRLHEFWDAVTASTLEFSGIRLRNAVAR
jgi:hypothetical protein